MKTKLIKILCLALTFTVLLSSFGICCFAQQTKTIEVEARVIEEIKDTKGNVFENGISVEINFNTNPGIGAFTFTLKYDKNVFMTKAIRKTKFYSCTLANYSIVDHPDGGYISFVWANQSNATNITKTGNIITVDFYMAKKLPGNYRFVFANINPILHGEDMTGCFADFEHNKIDVKTKNASYFIPNPDGSCAVHDYGEYETYSPNCLSGGYTQRQCQHCGKIERTNEKPALGHSNPTYWTVDRAATKDVSMIVSHYCTRCNSVLEKDYISSERVSELNIENKVGAQINNSLLEENTNKTDNKEVASKQSSVASSKNNTSSNNSNVSSKQSSTEKTNSTLQKKETEKNNISNNISEKILINSQGNKVVDKNNNGVIDDDENILVDEKGKKVVDENNNGVIDEGETEISDDAVYSADDVIDNTVAKEKEKPKTFGDYVVMIRDFIFGNGEEKGVFGKIFSAIGEFFKELFR